MWNEPTKEELAKIPRLYETEDIPLKNNSSRKEKTDDIRNDLAIGRDH